jgi:hypothetical protein
MLLREYSKICNEITSSTPDTSGVYLWGYFGKRGLWENVYLGCAGFGKTACLKSRIREELRDEKCFVWATVLGEEKILAIEDAGRKHRERSMRKKGTTRIIWVATPDLKNSAVHDLESDLIEALNPKANLSRPTPPHQLQRSTGVVFSQLRQRIHASRP